MNFVKVTYDLGNLIFETEDGHKEIVQGKFDLIQEKSTTGLSPSYFIPDIFTEGKDERLWFIGTTCKLGSGPRNSYWLDEVYETAVVMSRKWKLEALGI